MRACVALVLLVALVGAHAADLSHEITYYISGGRQYSVSNPQDSTSGIPLILYYHGINCGCTQTTGDIIDAANAQGWRVLIGSVCGVGGAWDVNGNRDVDYTKAVINDIASKYPIDRSKVFVAGWSMGGMMTSHLACVDDTFIAGFAMVSCGFGCDNPRQMTNVIGIQGIYDSVCPDWVTGAYASWAKAEGCGAGSGDVRHQVCSGKKVDLWKVPGPHMYLNVPDQVAFFKSIAGSAPPSSCSSPANPANGKFTCSGATCTAVCNSGYAATGAGYATCANGVWGTLPACVPTGGGAAACNLASENNGLALSCASGSVINAVEFASYGNPTGDCTNSNLGSCHAINSLSVMQDACTGKASCNVNAANSVFGDPCSGTGKQLAVRARCAAATSVCGTSSEWNGLTLACPSGQNFVGFKFASFGTPAGQCGSFAKSSCHASTSLDVVQKACAGKNSCSFSAPMINTFGDPCSGTGKQLAIEALCA